MSAIFLDRDGVIIRKAPEGEYVARWSEVEFLPGALDAIQVLHSNGYKLMIVTNQRGVSTGKIALPELHEIHRRMKEVIFRHGGCITAIYYCPHDYSDQCSCRKPSPGMLFQAAADYRLTLSDCWMVGDSVTDIVAGKNAGCSTALIERYGETGIRYEKADIYGRDLAVVAREILALDAGRCRAFSRG